MKIYVASSWRNDMQPKVVEALRFQGHEVYDFKNPEPGNNGFHWSEIDPNWKNWTPDQFANALLHPIAELGFERDMKALMECDACVLVMPCGRSAHLEAGYAIGAGKPTIILLADGEPELMYKMADFICLDIAGVQGTIDYIADEIAKGFKAEAYSQKLRNELERYKEWVKDLQSGMYVNCVYCGHRYGPSDKVPVSMADALKRHIENCPEHPLMQCNRALELALKDKYEDNGDLCPPNSCRDDPDYCEKKPCDCWKEYYLQQAKEKED